MRSYIPSAAGNVVVVVNRASPRPISTINVVYRRDGIAPFDTDHYRAADTMTGDMERGGFSGELALPVPPPPDYDAVVRDDAPPAYQPKQT